MADRESVPAGGSMTIRAVAVYSRGIARLMTHAIPTATPQLAAIQSKRERM